MNITLAELLLKEKVINYVRNCYFIIVRGILLKGTFLHGTNRSGLENLSNPGKIIVKSWKSWWFPPNENVGEPVPFYSILLAILISIIPFFFAQKYLKSNSYKFCSLKLVPLCENFSCSLDHVHSNNHY